MGTLERMRMNGHQAPTLQVRLDDGRLTTIRDEPYRAFDHGYALTTHKAQGITVDRTYVLTGGPMADRELTYVQMSRHRDTARLYVDRPALDGLLQDTAPTDAMIRDAEDLAAQRRRPLPDGYVSNFVICRADLNARGARRLEGTGPDPLLPDLKPLARALSQRHQKDTTQDYAPARAPLEAQPPATAPMQNRTQAKTQREVREPAPTLTEAPEPAPTLTEAPERTPDPTPDRRPPVMPSMPPLPPGPLPQVERYHHAVNADRYRVTAIPMDPAGRTQALILDQRGRVTRGFTPAEIASRTPELQRLQQRGENLYYTPLSAAKHHILIDDLDRDKLERFIQDGYQPAVVLESSPGNYQAIITIPKRGTPHDRDVGNRLAEQLNREYGDPKLSGGIHPHRAPGYENRKPKHQREDGSYPDVTLLRAERRECATTLERARQLEAQYQQQARDKIERQAREPRLTLAIPAAAGAAVAAYQAHYQDVRRLTGGADLSRVDAMIAVRLRVTGHRQEAIAATLRQCAPSIRPDTNGHPWEDYAHRTARYAFSPAGDRQVAILEKYRDHWLDLEGRAPARDHPDHAPERAPDRHPGREPDRDLALPDPPTRRWDRERDRDHGLEMDF